MTGAALAFAAPCIRRREAVVQPSRLLGSRGPVLPPAVPRADEIGLGSAVLVSLCGGPRLTEEGVVVEVAAGQYVVQCRSRRVLRRAAGLLVVAP